MSGQFVDGHPNRDVVARFLRGAASPTEAGHLVRHLLAGCAECRKALGDGRAWGARVPSPRAPTRQLEGAGLSANVLHFPGQTEKGGDDRRVFDRLAERLTSRQRVHAEERREVPALLSRLAALPPNDRQAAIRSDDAFHRWLLVEALLEDSRAAGFAEPRHALELAELAVAAVESLGEDRYPVAALADLAARSWATVGNAWRILGRFVESDRAFDRALHLLDRGTGDPAERSRVTMMVATLRARQGRLEEAEGLLDRGYRLAVRCDDRHLQGSALVRKSRVAQRAGDTDRALELLDAALTSIDPERDARLLLTARHNHLLLMVESGRYREALDRIEETRALHRRIGGRLDLIRFRWLEGRLYAGLGWLRQASGHFEDVRRGFAAAGLAYDAALVSLDLAAVRAQEGRTAEVRDLAEEVWPIFRSREAHQEALAALLVFRDAARREEATVRLIHRAAGALRLARRDDGQPLRSLDAAG